MEKLKYGLLGLNYDTEAEEDGLAQDTLPTA